MILMLKDLIGYRRTIEGKFGIEHGDSTTPSKVVGEEGLKLENLDH